MFFLAGIQIINLVIASLFLIALAIIAVLFVKVLIKLNKALTIWLLQNENRHN